MSDTPGAPSSPGPERGRPAKVDPWEERERERERYRREPRSRSVTQSRFLEETWAESDLSFRENFPVTGLLISLVLLVASGIPHIESAVRYILLQMGGFLSLLLLGTCRKFQDDMRKALLRGPNPLIVLLVLWAGYEFLISPYRNFAATEFLRVISGLAVYFLAAYTLRTPRQVSFAIFGLLGFGVLVALYDLARAGRHGGEVALSNNFSVLGTHQHAGSFFTLLLPVALVFAIQAKIEEKRRLAATAATLVLGVAVLLSRSRTGWLATFVALLVLAALYWRYIRPREPQYTDPGSQRPWQRMVSSPIAQVLIGLSVFLGLSNIAPLVSQRASVLRGVDDAAFTGRLTLWHGAQLMIAEKPLTGWGLGTFPVLQGQYSHTGDDTAVAMKNGTAHDNNAHNYYLQWMAETGALGLLLHIAVIASFLITALSGLPQVKTPFQTALLSGTIAVTVASLVDSLASPMYHFAGIWALVYVWMGLGVAALRPIPRTPNEATAPALGPTAPMAWFGSLLCGLLAVTSLLLWARQPLEKGRSAPRGTLQIIASPVGPIPSGTSVIWTAVFTDEKGNTRPTMPGTLWQLAGDPAVIGQAEQELFDLPRGEMPDSPRRASGDDARLHQSILRVLVPNRSGKQISIGVKATYRDDYGRLYEAWSYKTIGMP